jgi:NADH:ubiquinone oxidoreductase subunit F (NADH-binding)/(2Fe-2S) ferredoxin/NAD-dependent dihydropyrimidine dehydrogenase PreA subunit
MKMEKYRANLLLCAGTGCVASGTPKVTAALKEELEKRGLADEIKIVLTGCNGFCAEGPVMLVYPEEIFYQKITVEEVPTLVEEHFLKGRPYEKLMFKEPEKRQAIPLMNEIPFFKHQVLRVLRNKGLIDPESLDEYIARDGYTAAAKALYEMSQEDIIKVMKDAGLRGRGGAGFPTGLKWEFASKSQADQKFMLCNGDEGDPGAFMDRSVMESDPHSVIEGMIIGAKAIGSSKGVIYVRAEYPLAVARLQKAIDICRENGLLGENILGSGFSFDLEIYLGAGAFVCGEETALMRSIEGQRGMPRPRPPFPAHKGLWDKPSVLNNVETLAQIAPITLNGAEWYRNLGTEKSPGTKVFALTGDIKNVGLVEVPMGIPLRTIIYDIGGGVVHKKKKFKSVQMGGPSGGCIPEHLLDIPVTYEDIMQTGAIMGSGGMVVMDEDTCMVSTSKFFLEFTADESCGKCTPCRVGTRVMLDMLIDITEGKGKEGDIETLEDLSRDIIATSLCGLGQTAPNPVLTTIKYFRHEYESHIRDHWCTAGICSNLCSFDISEELCKGCQACLRACPQQAIVGEKKKTHRIIQELCIQCRSCYDTCKFGAIKIGPAIPKDKPELAAKD